MRGLRASERLSTCEKAGCDGGPRNVLAVIFIHPKMYPLICLDKATLVSRAEPAFAPGFLAIAASSAAMMNYARELSLWSLARFEGGTMSSDGEGALSGGG